MARKKIKDLDPISTTIDSINYDSRGVCRVDGKVVFVENALPGENITFKYRKRKKDFDEAYAVEIENPSKDRISAKCELFGVCGGCNMQHIRYEAQLEFKQKILLETLQKIGKVEPKEIPEPISENPFRYRRKARLGVRFDPKKNKVFVGFREKQSSYIVEADSCPILASPLDQLFPALRKLITKLSIYNKIPQIEYAKGDNASALVFRHLAFLGTKKKDSKSDKELSEQIPDKQLLIDFGLEHDILIYLQPKGLNSIHCISENKEDLYYNIPEFDLKIYFLPVDFIQVNAKINLNIISKVMKLLEIEKDDNVLDLFCGIGNFSLCIAKSGASVTGVEGEKSLCDKAATNAEKNNIANCTFFHADLNIVKEEEAWRGKNYNKILLDPPRSGAFEIVKNIKLWNPEKICYVSCNPSTLARDAAELKKNGYELASAGIADMFPQTAHSEAVSLFIRI